MNSFHSRLVVILVFKWWSQWLSLLEVRLERDVTLSLQVDNYEAVYRIRCDSSIFVSTIRLVWHSLDVLHSAMSASWNVSWHVFDRICSWSSFMISLSFPIESDLHSSARFPIVVRNLFVFYKWSSSSYSPEVVRSSTLITDSLTLDIVCSSVSQDRSRQRDSVSTCLVGTSWCRILNIWHRTQLQIELSLFFLLAPSTVCLRLRHCVITAPVVKDLRVLYTYYWRCSSSVTSWTELLSTGRSSSSSQSGLFRLEQKTISIMTLANFVTVSEYLRWSCHIHDEFLRCQTHNCLSRDLTLASLLEFIFLISIWFTSWYSSRYLFHFVLCPLINHAFRHRRSPYRTSFFSAMNFIELPDFIVSCILTCCTWRISQLQTTNISWHFLSLSTRESPCELQTGYS